MEPLIILGIALLVVIGLGPRYFRSKNTEDNDLPIPKKNEYEAYFKKYLNELYPYDMSNPIHNELNKIPYEQRITIQLRINTKYDQYDILTKEQYNDWQIYSQYITIELNVKLPKTYTYTEKIRDTNYVRCVDNAIKEFFKAEKDGINIGDGNGWRVSPVWIKSKAKHIAYGMINNK